MLAGNPHPDAHGNPGVWHFFTGLNEGNGKWHAIPTGSLLARWLQCDDAAEAAALAAQIAELATGAAPDPSSPDAELYRQLTTANGPLFSRTNFPELAERATADEIAGSKFGLDPKTFNDNGDISTGAPSTHHIILPRGLFGDEARFAVTCRLDASSSGDSSVQLRVTTGKAPTPQVISPSEPITVLSGNCRRITDAGSIRII